MPNQYTFNLLDPREFEFLCRDLLQRKIGEETGKAFFFNSFSQGADGGIDAIFQDKKHKIILQCKRYSEYDVLYDNLKYRELANLSRLQPTRYILAISCKLSKSQLEEIFALFKPYVKDISDILGEAMLNNLLGRYPDIELNYPRLYFNNSDVLNKLINANVYNQSREKLKEFQAASKYYVTDNSFKKAKDVLEKYRYVIISGEPGVGKSTLAGMLSLQYLLQEYEFIFVRRSIAEAEGGIWYPKKKQLFFFDDFLGSTTFEGFDRNEDRQLLDFIRRVGSSKNKLLLITTREYVFRQAELNYPELKDIHFNKCMIRQKEFTPAFKINILYNYLYYSQVELFDIAYLVDGDNYVEIIEHKNFTPRLINDYITRLYKKNDPEISLFHGLLLYLEDPYSYWEKIFQKLTANAQMLLLILAITEEPAADSFVSNTFLDLGQYRKIYEPGYEQDSFNNAIAELSESFISIAHNQAIDEEKYGPLLKEDNLLLEEINSSKFLEFQNPSIKDFAVNYLRKREDLIELLIKSATLYNQFFFVFTTLENDNIIKDEDSFYPYSAGKILLSPKLSNVLATRIIQEFNSFPIAKVKKVTWEEGNSSFYIDQDEYVSEMEKLRLLGHYFPLESNKEVRDFIIKIYQGRVNENKKTSNDPYNDFFFSGTDAPG